MVGIPEMHFIAGTPPDVHPMLENIRSARVAWVALPFSKMSRFVSILISQARFVAGSSSLTGMAIASRTRGDANGLIGPIKEDLVLKWRSDPRQPDAVLLAWKVEVSEGFQRGQISAAGMKDVDNAIEPTLRTYGTTSTDTAWRRDPVVPPGGVLDEPWEGRILDYRGCAVVAELCDPEHPCNLLEGTLPLGRWAFGKRPREARAKMPAVHYGPPLFVGFDGNSKPLEFKGTLICAPPGAGKTELTLRWAVAAIQNGYSILIVDVKGGVLNRKLTERLARGGGQTSCAIHHFSTDPNELECDRVNFLAGFSLFERTGPQECERMAYAILPRGSFSGDEGVYYANRVAWLTGLIGILKLHELSTELPGKRQHDLSDLCRLASEERLLLDWIRQIDAWEQQAKTDGDYTPACGLDYWLPQIIDLLPAVEIPRVDPDARKISGQRDHSMEYVRYTRNLLTPILPFRSPGVLSERIQCPFGAEGQPGQFLIDDLYGERQVAIVLSVPDEGMQTGDSILSLVIGRVSRLMRARFNAEKKRPILLLLDETRRIHGFNAAEFISFARESEVGVVVVYQDLDQITERRSELLGIVGVQIYLKLVNEATFNHFQTLFEKRTRKKVSRSDTPSVGGSSESFQYLEETVDFLERSAAADLPAGEYPALVYIRDHPSRKPFLVDLVDCSEVREFAGHSDMVTAIAVSSDGQTLLSGSADHSARLWSLEDGRARHVLLGHEEGIVSVTLSADGLTAATLSTDSYSIDSTLCLWRVNDGARICALAGHRGPRRAINAIAFSPDSSLLASASDDATICIWRVADGALDRKLGGHAGRIMRIAFAPDGQTLASASDEDATTKLWQVASGKLLHSIETNSKVVDIVFSPDGQILATRREDSYVSLWRASDAKPLGRYGSGLWALSCMAFAPDGRTLATGDVEGIVRLWDVASGKLQRSLGKGLELDKRPLLGTSDALNELAHLGVLALRYSPDGQLLATGHADGKICFWLSAQGRLSKSIEGSICEALQLAFTPNGRFLVSATQERMIRLWRVPLETASALKQ
jgi:WD40 repeat protein